MRELLIKWLGIRSGEITAYEHIIRVVDEHGFNAKQLKSLSQRMIEDIKLKIEEDEIKLKELNAKE